MGESCRELRLSGPIVWDFYKMVNCCHDCYRVYLYKDRQRMMSKTRPPVSAKMWREETAHLEDPRALEAASRSVGGLGHTSNASSRGARVAALMGTQIKTAGQMIKDNESGFARRMREADVHEAGLHHTRVTYWLFDHNRCQHLVI